MFSPLKGFTIGSLVPCPGDLNAFLYNGDRALFKDQQPAGCRGGAEHGVAGLVARERKGGELPLEKGDMAGRANQPAGPRGPTQIRAPTR
jgi:hypothetical protein